MGRFPRVVCLLFPVTAFRITAGKTIKEKKGLNLLFFLHLLTREKNGQRREEKRIFMCQSTLVYPGKKGRIHLSPVGWRKRKAGEKPHKTCFLLVLRCPCPYLFSKVGGPIACRTGAVCIGALVAVRAHGKYLSAFPVFVFAFSAPANHVC